MIPLDSNIDGIFRNNAVSACFERGAGLDENTDREVIGDSLD
jgi:hypothetical protein